MITDITRANLDTAYKSRDKEDIRSLILIKCIEAICNEIAALREEIHDKE